MWSGRCQGSSLWCRGFQWQLEGEQRECLFKRLFLGGIVLLFVTALLYSYDLPRYGQWMYMTRLRIVGAV